MVKTQQEGEKSIYERVEYDGELKTGAKGTDFQWKGTLTCTKRDGAMDSFEFIFVLVPLHVRYPSGDSHLGTVYGSTGTAVSMFWGYVENKASNKKETVLAWDRKDPNIKYHLIQNFGGYFSSKPAKTR